MTHVITMRLAAILVAALAAALSIALVNAQPSHALSHDGNAVVRTAERVPSMTGPKAKSFIARVLKQNYKRVWVFGEKKRITDCKRLSKVRVTCKVSWFYKKYWLHGQAAAYYRENGDIFVKYNIDADKV